MNFIGSFLYIMILILFFLFLFFVVLELALPLFIIFVCIFMIRVFQKKYSSFRAFSMKNEKKEKKVPAAKKQPEIIDVEYTEIS